MVERLPHLNARLQGYATTIFAEMSALAIATNSINLGQGFPDVDGDDEIKDIAIAAISSGDNQYPPGSGVLELRRAVARHQALFYGLTYDAENEVLITAGATEAVAATLLALCEVGDEVIMFEPFYDSYAACTAMSGAQRRVVRLHPPHWSFDKDELVGAVTSRTRLVLVNSPHNPTGKVFTKDELGEIAKLCLDNDLIAVTDEVYEHLVLEGEHHPLASFPGMRERTISISSGAKTFSFTGWKVGWACAPAPLISAVRTAKQYLTYVTPAPFQLAIAHALDGGTRYIEDVAPSLRLRRDLLANGLEAIGFDVFDAHGTFFLTTDISKLSQIEGSQFCRSLPARCGVVAIPSSVFYDDQDAARSLVRWTFCKRIEVLNEALTRLGRLRN